MEVDRYSVIFFRHGPRSPRGSFSSTQHLLGPQRRVPPKRWLRDNGSVPGRRSSSRLVCAYWRNLLRPAITPCRCATWGFRSCRACCNFFVLSAPVIRPRLARATKEPFLNFYLAPASAVRTEQNAGWKSEHLDGTHQGHPTSEDALLPQLFIREPPGTAQLQVKAGKLFT